MNIWQNFWFAQPQCFLMYSSQPYTQHIEVSTSRQMYQVSDKELHTKSWEMLKLVFNRTPARHTNQPVTITLMKSVSRSTQQYCLPFYTTYFIPHGYMIWLSWLLKSFEIRSLPPLRSIFDTSLYLITSPSHIGEYCLVHQAGKSLSTVT